MPAPSGMWQTTMVLNKQSTAHQQPANKQMSTTRSKAATLLSGCLLYGLYSKDMAKHIGISWLPSLWALLKDRDKHIGVSESFLHGPY